MILTNNLNFNINSIIISNSKTGENFITINNPDLL